MDLIALAIGIGIGIVICVVFSFLTSGHGELEKLQHLTLSTRVPTFTEMYRSQREEKIKSELLKHASVRVTDLILQYPWTKVECEESLGNLYAQGVIEFDPWSDRWTPVSFTDVAKLQRELYQYKKCLDGWRFRDRNPQDWKREYQVDYSKAHTHCELKDLILSRVKNLRLTTVDEIASYTSCGNDSIVYAFNALIQEDKIHVDRIAPALAFGEGQSRTDRSRARGEESKPEINPKWIASRLLEILKTDRRDWYDLAKAFNAKHPNSATVKELESALSALIDEKKAKWIPTLPARYTAVDCPFDPDWIDSKILLGIKGAWLTQGRIVGWVKSVYGVSSGDAIASINRLARESKLRIRWGLTSDGHEYTAA